MSAWGEREQAALGAVVMNYAALDELTSIVLSGFVPGAVADAIFAGESMEWKLSKLTILADEVMTDAGAAEALRGWVTTVRAAHDRRNQLLHSLYLFGFDEAPGQMMRRRIRSYGGKLKTQEELMDLADLNRVVTMLVAAIDEGVELTDKLSADPAWGGAAPVIDT